MAVVLSIDAGTTGVRCLAINQAGETTHSAYREFTQHFAQPGWVEHDAEEIWNAVVATMTSVAQHVDDTIAAIGITNQRETVVAWDKASGQPRARAIVWQDRRTASRCEELTEDGFLPEVRTKTGLVLDPYFSATKMEWLLGPGQVSADADLAFGTIDSWLLFRLSGGVHATDPSNASRTMLFNITTLEWDRELCERFGVPIDALGEVKASSGRFATTTTNLPVPAGIPISGIAGDQQASLFGQACLDPGQAKNTYGTGSFVLSNAGPTCPDPVDGLLTTIAWTLSDGPANETVYAYEGAVFVTGAAIQWLRDGLEIISDAAEVGPLAASVPDSGGVIFVPALTGLGSPHWDARARGLLIGLTRATGRAEIARATVDAIAYQVRDVVDTMNANLAEPISDLRVDGGASVMDLLVQTQADQIGVTVRRSASLDTTALGAAYLAGIAEGVWESPATIATQWQTSGTFTPTSDARSGARYQRWKAAVERSRGWELDS